MKYFNKVLLYVMLTMALLFCACGGAVHGSTSAPKLHHTYTANDFAQHAYFDRTYIAQLGLTFNFTVNSETAIEGEGEGCFALQCTLEIVNQAGTAITHQFEAVAVLTPSGEGEWPLEKLHWVGPVLFYEENTISLMNASGINIYSVETLEEVGPAFKLSPFNGAQFQPLYINTAANGGYLVVYAQGPQFGIAAFNTGGELTRAYPYNAITNNCYTQYIGGRQYPLNFYMYSGTDYDGFGSVAGLYNRNYNSEDLILDLATGIYYGRRTIVFMRTNGRRQIELVAYAPTTPGGTVWYRAQLFDNGNIIGNITAESDIDILPYLYDNDDTSRFTVQWNDSADAIVATHKAGGFELTVDFNTMAITTTFEGAKATPANSYIVKATSNGGAYSLYSTKSIGAGDYLYYNLVLENNETGEVQLLTHLGGMYGGYNSFGFLRNSDIYITTLHSLRIIDPATLQAKPFAMPFGWVEEEGLYRELYTFRRDPETFEFFVLYGEYTPTDLFYSTVPAMAQETAPIYYQLALCNATGEVIKSYPLNVERRTTPFGIKDASFSLQGNELLILLTFKGHTESIGTFNLTTETFTPKPSAIHRR